MSIFNISQAISLNAEGKLGRQKLVSLVKIQIIWTSVYPSWTSCVYARQCA